MLGVIVSMYYIIEIFVVQHTTNKMFLKAEDSI